MAWEFLSYPLSPKTPSYGGRPGFKILERRHIGKKSRSRSQIWQLPNHIGTHIDFPAHFDPQGRTLGDFLPQDLIFRSIAVAGARVPRSRLIGPEDISWPRNLNSADLLLIQTGFGKHRSKSDYIFRGPGLSPAACLAIRERAPRLRGLGLDFISLTSYLHREAGRESHRILLKKPKSGREIVIIEDLNLSRLKKVPKRIIVSPLQVCHADGAPATVWAEV